MKKAYIFLGKKSPFFVDNILFRDPNLLSHNIRLNLIIGRAMHTNWGKKSVEMLYSEIRKHSENNEIAENELKKIFEFYKVDNSKFINDIIAKNSKGEVKPITTLNIKKKFLITKFFNFIEKNKLNYDEILDFLNKNSIKTNQDFFTDWITKSTSNDGLLLENLITFLEGSESVKPDLTIMGYLGQAYAINKEFNKARDCFFKASVFYNTTPWINYAISNASKNAINAGFQLGDYNSITPHPLLNDATAADFFENHRKFLEYNYTYDWKQSLNLDFTIRDSARKLAIKGRVISKDPKILFVTKGNWNFLTHLVEHIAKINANVDIYDFAYFFKKLEKDKKLSSKILYTPLNMLDTDKDISFTNLSKIDPVLFTKLQEADIIFCEWGNEPAIFLSRFAPLSKKLVVRMHSYEAFTHWHTFLNLGGIDGLIFVAPHIENIFIKNASPSNYGIDKMPNMLVAPNVKNFDHYTLEKIDEAKYTLGMAGFNKKNKGLLKALKILAHLKHYNSKWNLRLAGNDFDENSINDYNYWINECKPFIEINNLQGSINFDGFQSMPEWLPNIGYILSTSDREGTHEALLEGVASGCIPIILDWSMVKKFGGVKALYPFLSPFVLDNVGQIKSLTEKKLHDSFERDRKNLADLMRQTCYPNNVAKQINDFLEKVYEA